MAIAQSATALLGSSKSLENENEVIFLRSRNEGGSFVMWGAGF